MSPTTRLALLPLLLFAIVGALFAAAPARGQAAFSVTATPTQAAVPVGGTAIFRIRVEGQTTTLPSFNFDVDGGALAGIASLDPTAANVAEGSVFVTRDSEGTARLTVRLGGQALATAEVRFARLGSVSVTVNLQADADAAARTWRYEVLSASGQVIASLTANTSGDSPVHRVTTAQLPYGFYTVRQVLGSDTRTACGSGAFYEVTAPTGAATTIELAAAAANVDFVIRPCPDLPRDLNVLIPIDTLSPAPGIVGEADVLPGETPISEVRGVREPGPGNPLPPRTGNTAPAGSEHSLLLLALGAVATLGGAAASLATLKNRSRR